MKVAWVHSFPPHMPSSGVFMHLLAKEVQRQGADVALVYSGPLNRPGGFLAAARRLRRAVGDCDLIHAQYGSACGYVTSRLPGKKLITLRGSDWYGLPGRSAKERLHSAVSRWLTRVSLRRYAAVIAVSNRMKSLIDPMLSPRNAEVLPDGVDLTQFQPMDRAEARRKLGCAGDTDPWVLFCIWETGSELKRQWLAEAAVEAARRQIPNLRLHILNGKEHGRVPVLLNASNAVLLTSTHEGWPNIIKEALACNVPFVSTDVSDLREIAEAEPGCRIAEADPDDLARSLVEVLRRGRSETLRRHVEPMRTEEIARRLVAVYKNVLAAGNDS